MQTARERAAFEAGIKLGALYHQWVGTPVSPGTARSIEEAIEKSVGLQPHVKGITVRLDRGIMEPNMFGYSELQGLMLDVEITTRVEGESCRARIRREGNYPLMEIVE